MDDYNTNPFDDGYGDEPDHRHEEAQKINTFMENVLRGITAKIPPNVTSYVQQPSIKEVEVAASYVAQQGSRTLVEDSATAYTNAVIILTKGLVHDAVDNGKRIIVDEDFGNYLKTQAEAVYVESLYKAGIVEMLFSTDSNEQPDIVFTEKGKQTYHTLYIDELKNQSCYLTTLIDLAGGEVKSKELIRESLRTSIAGNDAGDVVGKIMSDIINMYNPDDDTPLSNDLDNTDS